MRSRAVLPNTWADDDDWVRDTLNRALVRYTKVLTAQPFDVAKTILQVYVDVERLCGKNLGVAHKSPVQCIPNPVSHRGRGFQILIARFKCARRGGIVVIGPGVWQHSSRSHAGLGLCLQDGFGDVERLCGKNLGVAHKSPVQCIPNPVSHRGVCRTRRHRGAAGSELDTGC
jgi:hypothetical protein